MSDVSAASARGRQVVRRVLSAARHRTGVRLIALALILAGCGPSPVESRGEPLVRGIITQIEKTPSGLAVLVEEDPAADHGDAKCFFSIDSGTEVVSGLDDEGAMTAGVYLLRVGAEVHAWSSGAILESYPCQTRARRILVRGALQDAEAGSSALD